MNDLSFFNNIKRNKLLFNILPNIITTLRIILTLIIICFFKNNNKNLYIFLCINALIFVSDIMDGKIARKFNVVSHIGELLDITADIFYVFTISIIMTFLNIIPIYYIFVIAAEFLIFVITSKCIKNDKRYFGFDILGRILAVIYYIIPSIMFVFFNKNRKMYNCLYNYAFITIVFFTLVVVIYRITLAVKKSNNIENNKIFMEEKL